ncbi:hypothetical protein KCU88_g199, partial [Aureobasidium melanogenum]
MVWSLRQILVSMESEGKDSLVLRCLCGTGLAIQARGHRSGRRDIGILLWPAGRGLFLTADKHADHTSPGIAYPGLATRTECVYSAAFPFSRLSSSAMCLIAVPTGSREHDFVGPTRDAVTENPHLANGVVTKNIRWVNGGGSRSARYQLSLYILVVVASEKTARSFGGSKQMRLDLLPQVQPMCCFDMSRSLQLG